jgi:type VI secretion system secreted protein VgrG
VPPAGSATSVTSTGALSIKVEKGAKLEIKEAWGAKAKKIQIEAEDELTIKVGSATFTMKKNGDVLVDGKAIDVKGSGDVKIKGSKTAVQ